jgi:hypothetical protein
MAALLTSQRLASWVPFPKQSESVTPGKRGNRRSGQKQAPALSIESPCRS